MCEYAKVYIDNLRKARKSHRCQECCITIDPGEIYNNAHGIDSNSEPFSKKTCLECFELFSYICKLPEYDCDDWEYGLVFGIENSRYVSDDEDKEESISSVGWLVKTGKRWRLAK